MAVTEIHPNEVRARRAAGETVFLLDVREDDEVAAWAYPDAIHIPLGQLEARLAELPTDVEIVCACHAGGRSLKAATFLETTGRTTANLTGGALEWAASDEG